MNCPRLICILLLCLLASVARANMDTLWTRTVMGSGNTTLLGGTPLIDGGFAFAGYSRIDFSHDDFFAARLNADGDVLWELNYASGPGNDHLESIVELPDGNLMAVGYVSGEQTFLMMGISAGGDSLWTQTYDTGKLGSARDVIRTRDGNVAVLGFRQGGGSQSDIWLLKCDTNGDTLWTRQFGEDETDTGTALVELPNGDLQLCGNYASEGSAGSSDIWTIRLDSGGNPIGGHSIFGSAMEERGYGVFVSSTGDIFLCGNTSTGGGHRGYLVREPPDGDGWEQTYSESGSEEQFRGVIPRLGGALCAGWSGSFFGQTRPLVIAVDANGTTDWTWNYGVSEPGSGFYGIKRVPSGGAIAFGAYAALATRRGFITRIAPPGGVSGVVRDVATGEPAAGVLVKALGETDFVMTGLTGVYSLELLPGTYDIVAYGFCVDSTVVEGIEVLERIMSDLDLNVGVPDISPAQSSVNMYAMNELLAVGYYRIENHGSGTLYYTVVSEAIIPPGDWITVQPESGAVPPGQHQTVQVQVLADTTDDSLWNYYAELHLGTNTCPDTVRTIPVLITVLETDRKAGSLVENFALHPAFPNPFNSSTKLRFDLPEPSDVTLELFNLAGQRVTTLISGRVERGAHMITLNLSESPSGVYLARLRAGSFIASQKIFLLK